MQRARIATLIAKELEALIREGIWNPGEHLPSERILAERFRVSRVSIREALRLLEASGLVEIRHGDGAKVRAPASAVGYLLAQHLEGLSLRDLYEFRQIVEPEAAALAAERAGSCHLAALEKTLVDQAQHSTDPHGFLLLDMEFHRLIAVASGNVVLQEIVEALNDGLRETRLRAMARKYDPVRSLEGHQRVLSALLSRNPLAAREAMRQHLREVETSALVDVPQGGDVG